MPEPRPSLHHSVVKLLEHRRLGVHRSRSQKLVKQAIDLNILKGLIHSRRFKEGEKSLSGKGDVRYDHGKLFIKNYANKTVDCYAVSDGTRRMRKLWSLPSHPRWEDETIIADYTTAGYHRPSLVVAKADSTLHRYSLATGQPLSFIRLYGSTKFTEMSRDEGRGWLILKSVKSSRGNPGSLQPRRDVLQRILIMNAAPIHHLYHLEIRKSVFGSDVHDVSVNSGLLLVLGQSKSIKLYSINVVLDAAVTGIYSKVDGFHPNVELNDLGPCLFSISSHHHFLQINENPWRYIKASSDVSYSVWDLQSDDLISELPTMSWYYPDNITFLQDTGGKLAAYGTDLRIYDGSTLQPLLQVGGQSVKKPQPSEFTRSGRKVRKIEYSDPVGSSHVALGHEDELDIIGVVLSSEVAVDSDEGRTESVSTLIQEVLVYDIHSLHLLARHPLQLHVNRSGEDVTSGISVILDLDILIIQVKSSRGTAVHIFQLEEEATTSSI